MKCQSPQTTASSAASQHSKGENVLTIDHPRVTAVAVLAMGILLVGMAPAAYKPATKFNAGPVLHLPLDGDCSEIQRLMESFLTACDTFPTST